MRDSLHKPLQPVLVLCPAVCFCLIPQRSGMRVLSFLAVEFGLMFCLLPRLAFGFQLGLQFPVLLVRGDIAAFERCNGLRLCGWTGGGVEQRGGQLLQHFLLPWCAAFEQIRDLQKLVGCAFPNADAFAPAAEGFFAAVSVLGVVHIVDNCAAQRIMRDCHAVRHAAQAHLGQFTPAQVLPFSQMKVGHRLIVQPGVVKGRGLRLRFQRGRPSSGQALCRTASIRREAGGRQGVCIRRGGRCFRWLRRSTPGRGRSSIPIPGRLIFAFSHFLLQSFVRTRLFCRRRTLFVWCKAPEASVRLITSSLRA